MIKYVKKFLPIDTLKLLYRGMIEQHLRFCCSALGNCRVSAHRILRPVDTGGQGGQEGQCPPIICQTCFWRCYKRSLI